MASIDRPRGKPRVRWTDPDGTPHARTCTTEKAARELLRDVQRAEDTGRQWRPAGGVEAPAVEPVALARIAAGWVADLDRRLAPRTVDRLVQMADAFVGWYDERHGAGAGPQHLSRATLEAYWDHVRAPATGRYIHRRTETTARKHLEAVHLLWEWAADREEYDAVPPLRRMTLPRRPATTPRAARRRPRSRSRSRPRPARRPRRSPGRG